MIEEEIREGDIVEIDYIAEFTKEHINEGKALVIWKGNNNQPLVRKLSTKKTIWTCYEHIARVVGHIDIEDYMDKALNTAESGEKQMADIELVVKMPEEVYKDLQDENEISGGEIAWLISCIKCGTVIPNNPTNGDMIKAMFNCMVIDITKGKVYVEKIYFPFDEDWWNAPYEAKEQDE